MKVDKHFPFRKGGYYCRIPQVKKCRLQVGNPVLQVESSELQLEKWILQVEKVGTTGLEGCITG